MGSNLSLENVTVTKNTVSERGGGIWCAGSNLSLVNVTVTENTGGGVSCSYSTLKLMNMTVAKNKGGGIYSDKSDLNLENATISGNSGAGIICLNSTLDLVNVTITENIAGEAGGGIGCHDDSKFCLVNTILWNNSPPEILLQDFDQDGDPTSLTIAYSSIQGGETGIKTYGSVMVNWLEGNLDTDPLFVDMANEEYHLSDSSPCLGAGIDSIEISGKYYHAPEYDFEGNPRPNPIGSRPDMGAYESELDIPLNIEREMKWLPTKFTLSQNYPNPFNPETNIAFQILEPARVKLTIYNLLGQKIVTLVDEKLGPGKYIEIWQGKDRFGTTVPSGVYVYHLEAEPFIASKKMLLLK